MATVLEKPTAPASSGVPAAGPDLEKLPVEQVLAKLNVKPDQGLTGAEAQQRLPARSRELPYCTDRIDRLKPLTGRAT